MSQTTFENAKTGDRVYSPLFKNMNPGDKTNAKILSTSGSSNFPIVVEQDVENMAVYQPAFTAKGSFWVDCGQVLFWANPIQEIPTRPKRKVNKKGFIGVVPAKAISRGRIALTTNAYDSRDNDLIPDGYQIIEIEVEVEE